MCLLLSGGRWAQYFKRTGFKKKKKKPHSLIFTLNSIKSLSIYIRVLLLCDGRFLIPIQILNSKIILIVFNLKRLPSSSKLSLHTPYSSIDYNFNGTNKVLNLFYRHKKNRDTVLKPFLQVAVINLLHKSICY